MNSLIWGYQNWYSGCPSSKNEHFCFWGHLVKGQGEIAGLWKDNFISISLDFCSLNISNLIQWMPLGSRWSSQDEILSFSRLNGGWMATEWWRERWISFAFQSPFSDHSVDWMAGIFQWPFRQLIFWKIKFRPTRLEVH